EVHHQPREARVTVAARDDVERRQERHARLQHRRELAREERDLLFADRATATKRLAPDLVDADTLAAQVRRRHGLRDRAELAADRFLVAVDALPQEGELARFQIPAPNGCGGHRDRSSNACHAATRW